MYVCMYVCMYVHMDIDTKTVFGVAMQQTQPCNDIFLHIIAIYENGHFTTDYK